jgi:hypothetical protein
MAGSVGTASGAVRVDSAVSGTTSEAACVGSVVSGVVFEVACADSTCSGVASGGAEHATNNITLMTSAIGNKIALEILSTPTFRRNIAFTFPPSSFDFPSLRQYLTNWMY